MKKITKMKRKKGSSICMWCKKREGQYSLNATYKYPNVEKIYMCLCGDCIEKVKKKISKGNSDYKFDVTPLLRRCEDVLI